MVYCYDGKGKYEKVLPIPPTCFFLTTTDSKCWCAIMRSEKTHTLACNEFFGMQWLTDAAARSNAMNTPATISSACNELRMRQRNPVQKDTHADMQRILWHAMNYGCGSAIVTWIQASKHKNITILNTWIYQHNITIPSVILKELVVCGGCNEWRLLIRHRAVRKDTHAGLQRMLRHAMNYWPATNSKSWCAIMRSEKTHTLACNECFGMQWITDAVLNPYLPVSFARKKGISMRTCSSMEWSLGLKQIRAKRILRLRDFRVKAS